ncbi:hypothetical protein [Streptomyces sp. NPDC008121]|uniref:hypothetical protein n=1 Tax=Streptomyces sp. NPDC008121 TaxID=3364809 RepID=UPI0036F090B1
MRFTWKAAVTAAAAACLATGLAGAASATDQPTQAAAASAAAETERAEPEGVKAQTAHNTVQIHNKTNYTQTLIQVKVTPSSWTYEQAIEHNIGKWVPRPLDVLEPGQTKSYGVTGHFTVQPPTVQLTFADPWGKVTYETWSTPIGGSHVKHNIVSEGGLRSEGHAAIPGQETVLSIVR